MTVDVTWPDHLLTLEDWIALPEDSSRSYELVEGVLVVSPRPVLRHQFAVWQLAAQIHPQLPHELAAVAEAELVVDPAQPPTVRVPDVLVIRRKALADDLARVQPEDVKLAVEILSAGSRRTDRVTKFFEYAEVGIEYYWLIDLDEPVSLSAYRLIDGDYELVAERSGSVTVELGGNPVTIDLGALTSEHPHR
ncbi:Uma2 family endonuclease [Nocardia abscessus]|uniref:Uma2 family endonuclease n=1 Tax=Nocardia TaxID=1817 RepID=UPI001893FA82|nr:MULTISPECIES: Uma2 family endonuclease [Nocardia]MBF6218954.1 Uma2 family endonuclease [Nocardia abscessus]MDE1668895.1 Uma2 family endonuclease [Nocardia gipuzkoensis]